MTPAEQLRAFIERVKGEHALCARNSPHDALRAVLALEETLAFMIDDLAPDGVYGDDLGVALARAAQKIGGGATEAHVEQDSGSSCSCGWTSHTKAWRAHAAHMRRKGFSVSGLGYIYPAQKIGGGE